MRWRTIVELPILVVLLLILGALAWMRFTPQGEQAETALREYLGLEESSFGGLFARSPSEAELAAVEHLRQRGVQVITEPPEGFVTSVNFKPAFAGKPVDEECMRLLASFPEVVSVSLAETKVTDEQLRHIQGLDKLASLQLGGTPVGDKGLAYLTDLPELTVLHLFGTQVTDAGLKHLKAIPSLRILDLRHTRVTDAGLEELQALDKLEHLLLAGRQITDKGLKSLYGLKNLGRITLTGCNVTPRGIAQLRKALPRHPQVDFSLDSPPPPDEHATDQQGPLESPQDDF